MTHGRRGRYTACSGSCGNTVTLATTTTPNSPARPLDPSSSCTIAGRKHGKVLRILRTSTSTPVGRMLNTRMQFVRQDMWQARHECCILVRRLSTAIRHRHFPTHSIFPAFPAAAAALPEAMLAGSWEIYANACGSRTHNSHNL